jgi:tetratricopeptide (TPR) repeat protein
MKKTSLALAFLLLAATAMPIMAQQTLPTPAQATAVSQGVQEAVKLAQGGNLAAAIKKLEDLRKQTPVASPPLLSLLGTLYLQANRPQEALAVLKPLADAPNAEAAVLYNAGRAAYALKQKELWISYLKRAATMAPNSPAARDLGLVFMRQGQVVEAYSLLRHWSMANPQDSEARIAAASLAVQLERPTEAEELLLNLKQDDPAIHLLRGRIQVQKGDGPGALALLEPLLAKHPKGMDLEVRRSLAEAYLLANRPADTVKVLTGKTGNHPALVLLLGRAQHRSGNAAGALATLKPLADKLPADASAVGDPRPAAGIAVEYGSLLVEGGRAAEGLPLLEKATHLYPASADAWLALGKAYDAAGRKADAAKARTQAEQIKLAASRPPQPTAAAQRPAAPGAPGRPAAPAAAPEGAPQISPELQEAVTLTSQNRFPEALTKVRSVLAKSPNSPPARALELRLLLRLNRNDEALRINEESLRQQPNDADLVYVHGAIQMARKNWAAAEKDLRHALELDPEQLGAMNDLAVLLINQGRKAEAKPLLEKVLQLNPNDVTAAGNLKALNQGGQAPKK